MDMLRISRMRLIRQALFVCALMLGISDGVNEQVARADHICVTPGNAKLNLVAHMGDGLKLTMCPEKTY